MKVETHDQLAWLFNESNFAQSKPEEIEWEGITWEVLEGAPWPHIPEASSLGNSCVQLANDNEKSNYDHALIGALVRLFAQGKLVLP